jgi:hypothetical protein
MNRIVFESSPLYGVLCVVIGIGAAFLLYKSKAPWGKTLNKVLFSFRATVVSLLCLLLIGIIIRQINNLVEKPVVVFLSDTSSSVTSVVDSSQLQSIQNQLQEVALALQKQGYDTEFRTLANEKGMSDFNQAFQSISSDFENKKIAGTVFISDGIYNTGLSPLYAAYEFPVHTIGIGDTVERTDISLKSIVHNKIAYEGNRFPILTEFTAKGFLGSEVEVSLFQRGRLLERKNIRITNENLSQLEFQPTAIEQGIQRYEIAITPQQGEWNQANNRSAIFVEVVAGKKKIVALASAPHPDIKALRSVIEKNANYEFYLHIPAVSEIDLAKQSATADLIIFFQQPDARGRDKATFQRLMTGKASQFFILGEQVDWLDWSRQGISKLEIPRQFDDVTPSINANFSTFIISDEAKATFNSFPPASVPFAKSQLSPTAVPLLFQRVGSVVTEKSLLFTDIVNDRKVAVMMGEGIWRWRLHEYARRENTEAFDEVFGKLIQYLTTTDDRRKFRCYPVNQQFSDAEVVIFETQVYNDIFEPVYGYTIDLEIINEAGRRTSYQFATSAGSTRYAIGSLPEGTYRYKASTTLNNNKEEVKGEFLVLKQQLELLNLTADFNLLRKLSAQTGGVFYESNQLADLRNALLQKQAVATLHTEEKYNSLIDLKWVFALLVLLITAEWFLRKYYGGY